MDGLFKELYEAFGQDLAEEMIRYILWGWSVDAAIQEVLCREGD